MNRSVNTYVKATMKKNCRIATDPLAISVNGIGGSQGDVSEEPVTEEKRKKDWRMSCDVDEATEGLENEL